MRITSREPNATVWTFFSNHALVLFHISREPESTGLELAQAVGITERATRRILVDLRAAGYIETEKRGRRNRYRVDTQRPMVRVGERELTAGQLLETILGRGARVPPVEGQRAEVG